MIDDAPGPLGPPIGRRRWMGEAGLAAVGLALGGRAVRADDPDFSRSRPPAAAPDVARKPLAAVVTTYHPLSHAYHIVGRFLWGYQWKGRHHQPACRIASLYCDQHPPNDVSRDLAGRFEVRRSKSVEDALTLGTDGLAVEGVLLIGEHGDYPVNAKGQKLYPRFEMFEQVTEVFRRSGRSVPVFVDKHLSYDLAKAKAMVATAEELKFPMLAGSSLPVTWRRPEYDPPLDTPYREALVAAYGPDEIYGFHALETLQCLVERRPGGETGVEAVTCLKGSEVWKAGDRGLWSWPLLEHALGRSETLNPGDIRVNCPVPVAFLVEYRDGLKASALLLNGHVADITFAGRVSGREAVESCLFALPAPPGANFFTALSRPIEGLFAAGAAPYPARRTLLTSGILDLALTSLSERSRRVETPGLDIAYRPAADPWFARGSPASPVISPRG